jgi:hypothetical protein
MGIPALQIELPLSLRKLIMSEPHKYIKDMAAAILETYNEVILPAWKIRKTPL